MDTYAKIQDLERRIEALEAAQLEALMAAAEDEALKAELAAPKPRTRK